METFLVAPGRVLAVTVEADVEPGMSEHVVHRVEAVVRAADRAVQHRMTPVGLDLHGDHLEQPVVPDGRDEPRVRTRTAPETW